MVRLIPGRIEAGRVIPEGPLPEPGEVRSVSILLEVSGRPHAAGGDATAASNGVEEDPAARRAAKAAAMARLVGILKDAGGPDELQQEYHRDLEERYR